MVQSRQQLSGESYDFRYSYNLAGSLLSETYPSGRVVNASYDGANRQTAATGTWNGTQTNYAAGATYAAHGALAGLVMGNSLTQSFNYNNRLQTSLSTTGYQSTFLFAQQLNWGTTNNNGVLQGETLLAPATANPQMTRSYSYDSLNRLTAASDSSGWSRQFNYDAWGNMWVTPTAGLAGNTPTANVYNSSNQIGGASYDSAGNLLSINGFTLAYDAENRQISATEQPSLGSIQELYLYDGAGQRVEKIAPAGNTLYVYDAFGQLAAQYNTFAASYACATCYLTTDLLGSLRMVTDPSGQPVTRHDYLPFGEETPNRLAGADVEQRFTGQIRDAETGIDYFNARYFTAAIGRFNSVDPENAGADPSDPQTWNGYSYVRNSPLVLTDSSGQFLAAAGGPLGAVIGGIIDIFAALFGLFGGGSTATPTFSTTVWSTPIQTPPAVSSVAAPAATAAALVIPGLIFRAEVTAKAPKSGNCSDNQRRFFNWLDNSTIRGMATNLGTTPTNVFTLAAKEGGWTKGSLDHNIPLNNPFGVNIVRNGRAVANKSYPSLQAAVADWETKVVAAPFVHGITDPAKFVDTLLAHGYNSNADPYRKVFLQISSSMPGHMSACGVVQ